MTFTVPLDEAKKRYPQYSFITALTPSAQKCAFHVRDKAGQDLCLKIISPDYETERLQREILALQQVTHPNVCRLREYAFSSRAGVAEHYLVEDFIAGRDLSDDLKSAPWDLKRATDVFAEVCDGLSELRRHDIVHRDLKPSNVRVTAQNRPVIIDFGLARHLSLPDLTRTVEGARIGTPLYFAPEQFDGTKYDIDHRTDLWALGVLLFEALCGAHPFYTSGMTMQQLRDAVCESEKHLDIPAFKKLVAPVQLLLRKLLSKGREHRPNDAAQVAAMLRKLGGSK